MQKTYRLEKNIEYQFDVNGWFEDYRRIFFTAYMKIWEVSARYGVDAME